MGYVYEDWSPLISEIEIIAKLNKSDREKRLIYAVRSGNVERVNNLLRCEVSPNTYECYTERFGMECNVKETVLYTAIKKAIENPLNSDHINIIRLLIALGANINKGREEEYIKEIREYREPQPFDDPYKIYNPFYDYGDGELPQFIDTYERVTYSKTYQRESAYELFQRSGRHIKGLESTLQPSKAPEQPTKVSGRFAQDTGAIGLTI